jgi:hypothetical protein
MKPPTHIVTHFCKRKEERKIGRYLDRFCGGAAKAVAAVKWTNMPDMRRRRGVNCGWRAVRGLQRVCISHLQNLLRV